ncbi:MAG TPA: FAD-dependent oxidoreductase [Nocardioidaceae bacterium]|nr:FAD-dependent oxidoreductase [Nocardioidaceae bacterium]
MEKVDRAVVVGGSIAGLAAAATLASRASEVVVVERHEASDHRRSTAAQGQLPHVMLASGARVLESLFPGFADELVRRGADPGSADPEVLPCHWVAAGVLRDHLTLPPLGFSRALCSRGLVEAALREATLALPNVHLVQDHVDGLVMDGSRTVGVRLRSYEPVEASLVVDASGRGSRIEEWLTAAGLGAVPHTEVGVDLRYSAYVVERRATDFDGASIAVIQNTAAVPRIGVALPREGGLWQIVLGGYFGESAPVDPVGAGAFARTLTSPVLADVLDRPFVEEPRRFTFRSSLRRHWNRMPGHPEGFAVVGDAVASFNPIYGQGMSSALMQAEALGEAVDRHGAGPGFARAAASAASAVADWPWQTATGGDFTYERTEGRRPPGGRLVGRYVERVFRTAASDELVNRALTEVQHLLAPPASLMRPAVMARVLRQAA